MKKKLLLPFISLLLQACSLSTSSSISSSTSSFSNESNESTQASSSNSSTSTLEESSSVIIDPNANYYKPEKTTIEFKDVQSSYIYKHDFPSSGDQKMLVIPVRFKNSNFAESSFKGYDETLDDIYDVFFGKSEDTGYESVSSYYYKSSYGKLNISGNVSPWFTTRETFEELSKLYNVYPDPTIYILREAVEWYKDNFNDIQDYDQDKDGRIDGVWLVYDYPSSSNLGIDWAYTYWDYTSYNESYRNPTAYTYAWASIDFMYKGYGLNAVDAHTYIHETGHMLGLPDYYDYDSKRGPAGALDMMDNNVGDHTAYSKYTLGWSTPYVVTGDCTIDIRPFESSGDMILIRDNWNGSAFDEYLLIEFYTPTGLNYLDSKAPYAGLYPQHFTNAGVKIYHVDSRLAWYSNYQYQNYTDYVYATDTAYTTFAHSNTASRSVNPNIALYTLLENGGTTNFNYRQPATNETLFYENDYFDAIDFNDHFLKDEHFNCGEYINYVIHIDKITDEKATISFKTL